MRTRKISGPLCITASAEYHLIFNPTKTLCESRIRALILGYHKAASANCATGYCLLLAECLLMINIDPQVGAPNAILLAVWSNKNCS